ncbi:hypothetical protein ACC724_37890, partial [Rhizobium ruizarguesonis]
ATSTISMDLVFRGAPDAGMASAALMMRIKQIEPEAALNGPFIRRSVARNDWPNHVRQVSIRDKRRQTNGQAT